MNKKRKCIKAFDSQLQRQGFQCEEGKTYTFPENDVSFCNKGFHAIDEDECPLSVFDSYPPTVVAFPSRYFKVEIGGVPQKDGKTIYGSEIKIGPEIGILGLVKAHIKWVKKHIKKKGEKHETEDYSSASNTGDYSSAEVSGKDSVAAVFGKDSKARGALVCWLVLAERGEWDYTNRLYPIIGMKAVKVDGKEIKPDTWYELKDGTVAEVK